MLVTRWEYAVLLPAEGNHNTTTIWFTHDQRPDFLTALQAVSIKDYDQKASRPRVVVWKRGIAGDALRVLGDWGWEMTGMHGGPGREEWFFKRPVQAFGDYSKVGAVEEV
ncbi:MAG: hypothetical protein WD557_05030 [Dehalococcoidia bacterium]